MDNNNIINWNDGTSTLQVGNKIKTMPTIKLNRYRITLAHDNGITSFLVTATDKTRAIAMLMQAENCPSHAILKAIKVKTILK